MLAQNPCASRSSSCIAVSTPIDTPTRGGSSESETSEATVTPNSWSSTSVVTTAIPHGKRRIAVRSSSPEDIRAMLPGPSLVGLTQVVAGEEAALDVVQLQVELPVIGPRCG